jgi:N-acetylmuramoyl-L-alanine amidase
MSRLKLLKTWLLLILSYFLISCITSPKAAGAKNNLAKIRATVIIDAGHGGKDPGAIGAAGLKEKDVCLDIALRIKRLLNLVMPEVKVVMTRESDIYVSLEQRIQIAKKAQGDLFISVHSNSSDTKEAKGFEVYSLDTASDRHAERLAARENINIGEKQSPVKFILADLRANAHRNESDQLARHIAHSLQTQIAKKLGVDASKHRGNNQAILHVLFVPMPAVLAELLFLSNPLEEQLLKTQAMRESCARGVVAGIGKFLDQRMVRAQNATKRN